MIPSDGHTLFLRNDHPGGAPEVRKIGKFVWHNGEPIFMVWADYKWRWREQDAWGLTWTLLVAAREEKVETFYMWIKDKHRPDDATLGRTIKCDLTTILHIGLPGVPDEWGQDVGVEDVYWDVECEGRMYTPYANPLHRLPILYIPVGALGSDDGGALPSLPTMVGCEEPPPVKWARAKQKKARSKKEDPGRQEKPKPDAHQPGFFDDDDNEESP